MRHLAAGQRFAVTVGELAENENKDHAKTFAVYGGGRLW
jgi:hypothetical protein